MVQQASSSTRFVFEGVGLELEGRQVLKAITVSVDVRRVGLIGRNGSGKSTFGRLLVGLQAPTSGRVRVDGVDVLADRRAALRTVGILFQNADHQIIFPTVEEELAFGLQQLGHSKGGVADRVTAILARFGKRHWAKEAVHRLSQGQKRLLCLMAVLAMEPKLIVLDEPFAGLDIPTQAQLARHLDAVDATLVHITHDPAHLTGYEHVLWLEDGALAGNGAPDAVVPAFHDAMERIGQGDDLTDIPG